MNIKIKSTGVSCLVGDDYDRVYIALKKQLGGGDEQLFTERIPGHEYLQWELPGDGWISLSEGDPLMAQEVRQELLNRKKNISQRFGDNQAMAQKILSVPDDSYVYYKPDADGHLQIRLTAWGYRYPERVGGGSAIGINNLKGDSEHVRISLMYNNKPLPGKELFLNGFKRFADSNGVYDVGELPIGYQFELKVGDKMQNVRVESGQGDIQINLTIDTTVDVKATLDNQPYVGAYVSLSYMGLQLQLTTDSDGRATTTVPLDPDNGVCSVSIDNEQQHLPLSHPLTVFTFNLFSPEDLKEEIKEEEPLQTPNDIGEDEVTDELKEPEPENAPEQIPDEVPEGHEEKEQEEKQEEDEQEEKKEEEQVEEEQVEEEQEEPLEEELPLKDEPKSKPSLIWEILVALLLLLLVVMTYILCYGLLFG